MRLRRPGAISKERADLRDPGSVHDPTGLGALERDALVARIENREPQRDPLHASTRTLTCVRAVPGIAPAFVRGVRDIAVEQEDLDLLEAVGEELEFDLGIGAGDAFSTGPVR
jgi:hypothetical protein